MPARGRRLSLTAAAVVLASGVLQGYVAFGPGAIGSWWHKAGASLMFIGTMIYAAVAVTESRGRHTP